MRYEMIHGLHEASKEKEEARALVLGALETFGEDTFMRSGKEPGPSVLLIGGVHGNEMLGVLAVAALREEIESGSIVLKAGTLRLMLGNTRAIAEDARTSIDGVDLNRLFTKEYLSDEVEAVEARRARRIAEEIKKSDITIDLHSTNRPSPPFVCASSSDAHRSVYRWLPRTAVVIDPERIISGGGGSIDEYADDCGHVGICYESGQATDINAVVPVYNALKAILIERGMIEGAIQEPPVTDTEYIVVGSVPYTSGHEFMFAPGKGEGFASIARDELIGYSGSEAILSPVDGVILFPKKPEHQELAGVVCYLASRSETGRSE